MNHCNGCMLPFHFKGGVHTDFAQEEATLATWKLIAVLVGTGGAAHTLLVGKKQASYYRG